MCSKTKDYFLKMKKSMSQHDFYHKARPRVIEGLLEENYLYPKGQ